MPVRKEMPAILCCRGEKLLRRWGPARPRYCVVARNDQSRTGVAECHEPDGPVSDPARHRRRVARLFGHHSGWSKSQGRVAGQHSSSRIRRNPLFLLHGESRGRSRRKLQGPLPSVAVSEREYTFCRLQRGIPGVKRPYKGLS